MKGYWHFIAISVGISILTVYFNTYWFLAGLFLWLFYLFYIKRLRIGVILVSLIFFLFFTTYIPTKEINDEPPGEISQQNNQFTGKISGPVTITPTNITFPLQIQKSNDTLLAIYFPNNKSSQPSEEDYSKLKHGATCVLNGKLEYPNQSTNPGQFNYRSYMDAQGISYQIIIKSLEDIQCEGSSFLNHIYSIRTNLKNNVIQNSSTETAAWLHALVLGDDSLLRDDDVELFQRWSLSHILAISGLHVGLIVALVYFILVKSNLFTKEKAQWIMICFLPIYALIAGGEPSVWRATTMVLLFIILNKTKLKYSMTDTLSIVFLLLIIFDKHIVYHIGFQLSFIVTLGLILSKQWLNQSKSLLWKILKISFVSQMMIVPLQLTYFSTFQPLSIILNVFVVPYFSLFVIPFLFLFALFLALPNFFLNIFDRIFVQIQHIFISFVEFIDELLYFPFVIGDFPIVITGVYYVLFFSFMYNIQKNKRYESFKYGCYITALIFCIAIRPYLSPIGTVTMLDIGQGDAFVIELPYRKGVIFIDAGASFSFDDLKPSNKVYKQVIKPYLYSRGIQKVDTIFVSHKHVDHFGSVGFLVKEMKTKEIIVSTYYPLEEELLEWRKYGAHITQLASNDSVSIHGKRFHALLPLQNNNDENENSLVLYTEIGGKHWLFTGDIEKRAEKDFLDHYETLPVDVLKVAHHGSDTSTSKAFIDKTNPTYALISVGENNFYGHPSNEVLDTLKNEGVFIMRTDLDGAVQFRYQRNHGTFFKYLP